MDSETCFCGACIQNQFSYGTQRVDNWLRDVTSCGLAPRPVPSCASFNNLGEDVKGM